MPKKKTKKNGKGVGGKADVHAHEEGKRYKFGFWKVLQGINLDLNLDLN